MCGFFAIFSKKISFSQKNKFLNSAEKISHRGPDSSGLYIDDNFALKCFRLSIVDLTNEGHQPILSEDKNIILGFNGEIYNHQDLRKVLIERAINLEENQTLKCC